MSERPVVEPDDEHNRKLVANVHPHDWVDPEPQERYHMAVIGGGTAGLVTAAICAGLGARVALVERHLMGGDCLNVGCVPSKSVIAAARAWHRVRTAPAVFGAPEPRGGDGDFGRAMERMRRLRAGISPDDGAARFRDLGVDVFFGEGRFVASDAVEVDGRRLKFRRATVATGARAAAPPIPGLAGVDYLTNETVFSLTELPRRLGVVGGGPVGAELAQAFARFGSEVHVFEVADHVLPREDRDAAAVVQKAMQADGLELHLAVEVAEVKRKDDETILVVMTRDGERSEVAVDRLLVSAGRAPNVEGLGLEAAGVEYDRSGVKVNDRLRTTNPRIFAAGDIADTPHKFTHAADAHARLVVRNAFFFGRGKASQLVIPWAIYTSPEIAHVGLYEEEARERGHKVVTLTVPFDENHRARLEGEDEGFLRIHLKKGSDEILGATVVSAHAGETIGVLAFAMTNDLGLAELSSTIFPYPTRSEILRKAGDLYRKRSLTPTVSRLLEIWFKIFK